ncbi:MAG TPA: protein-methionine-sulfoxide reductase heme-binding subunit MsrQ [Herpetosiphonaceae bacterium]
MNQSIRRNWLRIVTHVACLIPFALLLLDYSRDQLTVNPIQEATLRTGKAALVTLVLSLVCTPLNTLFGFKQALPLRRPLGLYAFFYALLHLTIFVAIDYGFDFEFIALELGEKRYVIAGFAAFLLLLPLALTSTKAAMRRLGKRWKPLHKLVYLAAGLAILHFAWLVKADLGEPLAYGAAVGGLLLLRVPAVRRALIRVRQRRAAPVAAERPIEERT